VISCSSSHTDGVGAHLEAWRQDGNDPDRVFVHDTTQAWATVTVTGPKARKVMQALGADCDFSKDAFPHMTFQDCDWQGHLLRIARVSFTGDISFEVSIRAGAASLLWEAIIVAAKDHGGAPIGIEALAILRAEKGYIMIGKDTDGETMPHDLGFVAPRDRKTAAFVGDRSLRTPNANRTGRKMLVGLQVGVGAPSLTTGAHLVLPATSASLGYVTSSYDSPALGHPIALAIIDDGANRLGETLEAWHMGDRQSVTVCAPCVYDPDGDKLHA
jgi:sarcosine oxidase subunit alpha